MVYEPMRRNGMFSDMFDDMFTAPTSYGVMSTDIHKKDGDYILDIEMVINTPPIFYKQVYVTG